MATPTGTPTPNPTSTTTGSGTTPPSGYVPVTGVSITHQLQGPPLVLRARQATLTATVSPSSATNRTVTWQSHNPSVCTVNSSGRVTKVGVGWALISATTNGVDSSGRQIVAYFIIDAVYAATAQSYYDEGYMELRGDTSWITSRNRISGYEDVAQRIYKEAFNLDVSFRNVPLSIRSSNCWCPSLIIHKLNWGALKS